MVTATVPRPGWRQTTLGEIGEYLNGRGFKKSEWSNRGRMIIRIQDLTGSGKDPNYFAGDCDEKHVVRDGDLLISWAATLDAFLWSGPEAVLNQHIFKVNSRIDRRFHYYITKFVLEDIRRRAHGSGMVHITKREFEQTVVAVPLSVEEQRTVADAIEQQLTRLEAATADLTRARRRVERHRQAVFEAAVWGEGDGAGSRQTRPLHPGDPLPDGWAWSAVGDLAHRVQYGSSSKTDADSSGIPVLRMGNIHQGRLVLGKLKFLPANHREFPELLLERGDILFNRTNSPDLVGKSAVYHGSPARCSFASYLIRVTPVPELRSDYLAYVLNSAYGRRWIRSVVSQQVGQANVNGSKLKAFRIPLPPPETQDSLVMEAERQLSLSGGVSGSIDASIARVRGLRQAIFSHAFTGRVA